MGAGRFGIAILHLLVCVPLLPPLARFWRLRGIRGWPWSMFAVGWLASFKPSLFLFFFSKVSSHRVSFLYFFVLCVCGWLLRLLLLHGRAGQVQARIRRLWTDDGDGVGRSGLRSFVCVVRERALTIFGSSIHVL
ncbi:hypothetical protein DFJ73DRAFT_109324 [Zopfochytrium polystomum]|nr:hypothetical protein DFJ73DRAFT_109324 [Zopfochytrium polystomum]